MKSFIVLLTIVAVALAGPQQVQRIVGGHDTTIEQWPYMANMQFHVWNILWMQYCGGALITPSAVLSAAHCYEGDATSSWRVYLGTSVSRGTGGSLHEITALVLHEDYNATSRLDADIAIVRLATPAVLSDRVAFARIAGPDYHLADHTPVHTIGWGQLTAGGLPSEQLQQVEINIINNDVCVERYAYLKTLPGFEGWPDVTPGMLCSGILNVGGRDACQGDSGGPLAHNRDILVGVVSWGYSCADSIYPGVNARVSYYSDWIVRHGSS